MNFTSRTIIAFVLPLLLLTQAEAGDFAQFRSLGFSKDGKIFAFEQFGVQDGSGFPYAERYFIATETDRFLPGTPVKIRLEEADASVADARAMVDQASFEFMQQYDIGAAPANIVAFNPSTEISSAAYELKFQPFSYEPNSNPPYELMLEKIDLPLRPTCTDIVDKGIGFRLSLKASKAIDPEIVYQDTKIPNSRRCPTDYRLGGVLTYANFGEPPVHIFLVLVKSFGFEGPDGRWIAIPKVMK